MTIEERDLVIPIGSSCFYVRTGALITHEGRMLVTGPHAVGGFCYPPGGKMQLGEPSRAALERELVEELGVPVRVGALRILLEHTWLTTTLRDEAIDGAERHEIAFLYEATWPEGIPPETAQRVGPDGAEFSVRWVPIEELAEAGFTPASAVPAIIAALTDDASGLQHLVIADDRVIAEPVVRW